MTTEQISTFVRHLCRIAGSKETETLTDAQLLERFVNDRDQLAFEVLIWRHGAIVLGVCRRLLHQEQDIEDAFQATFMTLARRARGIGKRESAGSWLYKVAYRAALRVRSGAVRAAHESLPADLPAPAAAQEEVWGDLRPVLDEAISHLPSKYRLPVILCYFEGKTHAEAAEQLGCPKGTVSVRLMRARELLRARFSRRGLVFSAELMGSALAQGASAATVPAALVGTTVKAALVANISKAVAIGVISRQAAKLADGIAQSMLVTRVKIVTTAVLALLLAATGAGLLAGRLLTEGPRVVALAESPTAPPAPEDQLEGQVRSAVAKAVNYLKRAQRDGNWEGAEKTAAAWKGGWTSLAMLALLKSGVKNDDPIIERGLRYLRQIEARQTYVVALQTMVYVEAGHNVDRQRIQNNANWLVDAMMVKDGQCKGWTYTKTNSNISDNSNAQYAVMALYAASRAGAKIPDQQRVWKKIQQYYLGTQKADGGWIYNPAFDGKSTLTMTCAGICGLAITRDRLKAKTEELDDALAKAVRFVGENFTLEPPFSQFYLLHSIARVGRLSGRETFPGKQPNERHHWYREGCRYLVDTQKEDGEAGYWMESKTRDSWPIISTSFALLFLTLDQ
jgi:RNA polymerase sigma factor (sigma-70 family)